MNVWSVVVERHERVLAVRDGELVEVLRPGRHRRRLRTRYATVDVRERLSTVAPQEILTVDGLTVKVSAVVRWAVADAALFTAVSDPEAVIYLAVQVALREQLAEREAADVVRSGRREVTEAVLEAARQAGRDVGIAVLGVDNQP